MLTEKKELLNMLRSIWRQGDSPLRRIYPSLEELESNVDIKLDTKKRKEKFAIKPCPSCGQKQKITKPIESLFPFHICPSCKQTFHVNKDLTVRKLTDEEEESMPEDWVRILEDLNTKKMAIVFKLE